MSGLAVQSTNTELKIFIPTISSRIVCKLTILAFLLQLLAEIGKVKSLTTEHGFRSIDDTYDVQLQSVLHHQLLLLATNLFYQTTANRTDTADKEIEAPDIRRGRRSHGSRSAIYATTWNRQQTRCWSPKLPARRRSH